MPNRSPAALRASSLSKASAFSTVTFAAPLRSVFAFASAVAFALESTASTLRAPPAAQAAAKPPE